jgi:hypothetical protein
MSKFDFLIDEKQIETQQYNVVFELFYKDFYRSFSFRFCSKENFRREDLVVDENFFKEDSFSRSIGGRIVKTDIQDSVAEQLRSMFEIVGKKREELLYLKMSKETQSLFRVYFSYEVSYPPKNLSEEDRKVQGRFIGSILGYKVLQDQTLKEREVQPVVRANRINVKIARMLPVK